MSSQQASTTNKVEQKAGQAVDQVQQQAEQLTGKAKQQATSQAETRKNQVAQELTAIADAVRQAGTQLRQQEHDTVANYSDMAAQRVDELAQTLQERDVNQLLAEAGQLARKRPGLVVGGAFAVGLLGARFLKSSSMPDSGAGGQPEPGYPYGYPAQRYPSSVPAVGQSGIPEYSSPDSATYSPYAPGREG